MGTTPRPVLGVLDRVLASAGGSPGGGGIDDGLSGARGVPASSGVPASTSRGVPWGVPSSGLHRSLADPTRSRRSRRRHHTPPAAPAASSTAAVASPAASPSRTLR